MSVSLQEQMPKDQEQVSYPRLVKISMVSPVPESLTSVSGTISFGVASIFPTNYEKDLSVWIILNAHAQKLDELRKKNIITEEEKKETLKQHAVILNKYSELVQYAGKTVVACAGDLFVGKNLDEAVTKAREKHGKRPYYAETVNLIAFTSLFPPNADKL